MSAEKITTICGNYPEGFSKAEVSNNPNFIFENDPSYQGVRLGDADGNTVFVNSFLECEHYVSGGWDNSPTSPFISEYNLQLLLGFCVVSLFVIRLFMKFYSKIKYV
tara:strand:- start:1279 stop:1599 length:321 start_codon:yes stop_codon:yes gene_type:complete